MSKVIVITGAGGVLCGTLAKALGKQGYKIAVLDIRRHVANNIADSINSEGGIAGSFECNVLDRESLENARSEINDSLGSCDVLINGAGGNHPSGTTSSSHFHEKHIDDTRHDVKTFFDLDLEGIKFVFDLNFMGTLLTSQVFAKDMVKKENCSILNISSMNAFTPLTKIPAYSAAKAAVSNFTQWLAVYFAKVGIRVNAIAPGFFLTDQNRELLTTENGTLTQRGNQIIDQTPMGKFGTPEDLVGVTLWLCGGGSSFVTGVVIPIDGGFSAYGGV